MRNANTQVSSERRNARWFGLGLLAGSAVFALDVALSNEVILIGALGIAPFVAALGATRLQTLVVGIYAVTLSLIAGAIHGMSGDLDHLVRIAIVALAAAFAGQIAATRSRAELVSELEAVISESLASAPTVGEGTSTLLKRVGEILGWPAGSLWEPDAEGRLACMTFWHQPGLDLADFPSATRALRLAPGEGLPGSVWETQGVVWIRDVTRHDNFPRAEEARAAGLRAAFGFPIVGPAGIRGVVEFFCPHVSSPDPRLMAVMTGLGARIGQFAEARAAEEEARRAGAVRAAVFEAAPDGLITMDADGVIREFSPAAERMFGWSRSEAVGRELADLIVPPHLRERHREALARYVAAGRSVMLGRRLEMSALRKDGSEFPVDLTVVRIGSEDPPMFAGSLRDITDRRRRERERQDLLDRETTARMRSQRLEREALFLGEVHVALDRSFDFSAAGRRLAGLLVPRLADWCAVHLLEEDGTIRLVAAEHSDPEKRDLAWALERRYPITLDKPVGIARAVRTGEAELLAEIPDALIDAGAHDAEHAALIRGLGLRSAMIVPLKARDQTLGAIALASDTAERRFGPEDLALAVEVARRAALSMDNARLFQGVQESGEDMRFLARASLELDATLELEETLQRLADLTVPYLADGCMVDLLEGGVHVRRAASAAADPSLAATLDRLRAHRLDLDGPHPIATALRSGELQTVERVTDDLRRAWSADADYLEAVNAWPARSAVVAPMVARGRVLGTIALASFGERRFDQREHVLIEELARRAAVAVDNARLYGERSHIAARLSQSLLPPYLPEVPGVEIAARFRPAGDASEVGGDFYDMFPLSERRWVAVVADVCGKGVEAAALTAMVRYTLRAGLMRPGHSPQQALAGLNEALLRQVTPDQFCTAVYASLELGEGDLAVEVASAGHPLPLLVRADGTIEEVGSPGTLLGVLPDPQVPVTRLSLGPGDTLLLFTDGLIEARTPTGPFGTEGVVSALEGCAGLDAATLTDRIEQVLSAVEHGPARDDVAILTLQATAEAGGRRQGAALAGAPAHLGAGAPRG